MIESAVAKRLGSAGFFTDTTIYKFEKIKRAKAEAKRNNKDLEIIDMGVGEPDKPAHESICEVLRQEASKPENRWYADNGIPEFQNAAADFLNNVFGVKLPNAEKNIIHGIGSKPIFALLPLCFIDPGDVALVTTPGYPVIGTYTNYLGGEVYKLPLREKNGFLPDFQAIPAEIKRRAKILYLNYPNNPTAQVANREFFEDVVAFAKANNIIVIHDAAYSSIVFHSEYLSFLAVEGALDVGIEVHSLSKAFNMTGWRLGFVAGNEKLVKLYGAVKDNTDSGQFRAIQKAGVYALNHAELIKENQNRYSHRMDLLVNALNEVGFSVTKPKGTFYCYTKAPVGTGAGDIFATAEDAAQFLIRKSSISTVPWDECGAYLRFSVTFEAENEAQEIKVFEDIKRRLAELKLQF